MRASLIRTGVNQNRVRFLTAASISAMALLAQPAMAQQAPAGAAPAADAGTGLNDIIVTARKVSEKLQDVPVSVTAFSGQDLKDQGTARVEDLAQFTPGLQVIGSAADTDAPIFASRGQAQTDVIATLEPSVGVYLDGIYVARSHGLNADLLDIASVQTLKGPQGTLFGHNTSAGAILLQTNDPKLNETSGSVSGTYGRFNEADAAGIVNVPLIKDKLA
jgi:iron complex outermembrane receptor protein